MTATVKTMTTMATKRPTAPAAPKPIFMISFKPNISNILNFVTVHDHAYMCTCTYNIAVHKFAM